MTISPQPCLAGAYELWLDLPSACPGGWLHASSLGPQG